MDRVNEYLTSVMAAKPSSRTQHEAERIETTLGDLISAIADAAGEAQVGEHEIAMITQVILGKIKKSV